LPDHLIPETINHLTHVASEGVDSSLSLSLAAIVIALLSFIWSMVAHSRERRARAIHQAIDRWDGVLTVCNEHPELLLPEYPAVTVAEGLSYEAYNYKAWSLVDYIISNGLHREPQFRSMINWICTHNRTWLAENPFMFGSDKFWKVIGSLTDEPLTLFRTAALPLVDDRGNVPNVDRYEENINWDLVAVDYDKYIITPLCEVMVTPDPVKKGSPIRNHLLTYFYDSFGPDDLAQMHVADYGCGPGNLLKYVAGTLPKLTGIDISQRALDIAIRRAAPLNIDFIPVLSDIISYTPSSRYDLIFSINSIVPPNREEVASMLDSLWRGLAPNGLLLAIMPSFDTTERLLEYWQGHYATLSRNQVYLENCMKAFKMKKKFNPHNKSFADDNIHSQCFHTPETMARELSAAGLDIIEGPQKIYYPWEVTKLFDYGYFPGKEEIWDWFVVARRRGSTPHREDHSRGAIANNTRQSRGILRGNP
jgi:SAM-dependent methyltransferase